MDGMDPNDNTCADAVTTGNWCQTTPYLNSQGVPVGKTVFVATDCKNNYPLGFCRQQEQYLLPGVAANQSVYDDALTAHENFDDSLPIESTAQYMCMHDMPPYPSGVET